MAELTLEIVTPERCALSERVEHVVLPTREQGEIDVLPGHLPLMTTLKAGELRYGQTGQEHTVAIDKGFLQVLGDTVSVLTDGALETETLTVTTAEEARERAERALREAEEAGDDPQLMEDLESRLQFALMVRELAKNRQSGR